MLLDEAETAIANGNVTAAGLQETVRRRVGSARQAKRGVVAKGGPEREEMHVMFELLCKNRSPEAGEAELDLSYPMVTKVFSEAAKAVRT